MEAKTPAKRWVEYQCTYCGTTQTKSVMQGRPYPGSCFRRPKTKDNKPMPHRWVVNRRF